jgi:general stress protein 26
VVGDQGVKERFWREEWRDEWPDGASDPDYVLLKIVGETGAYYSGDTDEAEEIALGA